MICDLCLGLETIENVRFKHARYENCHLYPHHQSYVELRRSAEAGCRVCEFFEQELLRSAVRLQRTFPLPPGAVTVSAWFLGRIIFLLVVEVEGSEIEGSAIHAELEPYIFTLTAHSSHSAGFGSASILGRHFSNDPGSRQSFAWIEKSMHECCCSTSSHPHCPKQSIWDSSLPDRVLDLEASSEDGDLRLKTNERNDFLGQYIALSHCWGHGPQLLETTTKNIASHTKQIKFSDLSRSFRDAVRICRRLSVRYLWLDTLCILQDSRDDWAEQASKMASIYENAFLTLAFSGARNSEQAILSPRPPLPSVRLGGSLAHVHLRNRMDENADMQPGKFVRSNFNANTQDFAPLGQRAWAYQESFLSPRVLYFASCQLAWKCQEGAFVESSIEPHEFRNSDSSLRLSIPGKSANCIADWEACVEHFSRLSITVASDKLVAFSGIAKRFATLLQDEYVAGLWKSSLPYLLLWRTDSGLIMPGSTMPDYPEYRYVRPLVYRAPSWSWAAIDGRITHPGLGVNLDPHFRDMRLIRVATESATSDIFGAIKGAQIHVHGFCAQVAKISGRDDMLLFYRNTDRVDGVVPIPVLFFPDIASEFGPEGLYPPEIRFMCLQINRHHGTMFKEYPTQALILKEVGERSGVFRRVGCVHISDWHGDYQEWVERNLILI